MKSLIFHTAWTLFRKGGITFANALRNAYKLFKIETINQKIKSNRDNKVPYSLYSHLVMIVQDLKSQLVSFEADNNCEIDFNKLF